MLGVFWGPHCQSRAARCVGWISQPRRIILSPRTTFAVLHEWLSWCDKERRQLLGDKGWEGWQRCHGGVEAVFSIGRHGETGRHRRRFSGCCLYNGCCGSYPTLKSVLVLVLGLWGWVLSMFLIPCIFLVHIHVVYARMRIETRGCSSVGILQELSTFRGEGFLLTLWFIRSGREADEWAPRIYLFLPSQDFN